MTAPSPPRPVPDAAELLAFRTTVLERGRELYRDLPWRRTRDPYAIWISEVMLQQTQTSRVDGRWQRWLQRFPDVRALAAADPADVLDEWQGLGYNRRALALHRAAQAVAAAGGALPSDEAELTALPGIGPATAAGIRAFAFDLPAVYLETNVRSVLLHELFPGEDGVADRALVPILRATCPPGEGDPAHDLADDPRAWYYALLDYGAYLKRTVPNPSRRSRTHARQSRFEGSHRQLRAELLRVLLARGRGGGVTVEELEPALAEALAARGREPIAREELLALLSELEREGFCRSSNGRWVV